AVGEAAIAALAQSLRERAAARPRAVHLVTNIVIALDGERAQARSNWVGHRDRRRRTENRLGRHLPRRHREGRRALAVPLPRDRRLYRRLSRPTYQSSRFGGEARGGGMRMRPEERIGAGAARPFTGAEFLESLRDGREVYIDGERVADVTAHPAFRNSVRSLARLYDALHDAATKEVLTCPTDTGSAGFTHRYFRVARSPDELQGQQRAIAEWSRLSYGW